MAKVLIIEDEKAMSDLIAIKFQVDGFEVEQAFNLAEAKQKLTTNGPYNAVLTDYLLPDGNSIDLLTEIHSDPHMLNTPVIVMTNYIEDINVEKAKSLGVIEVLVKYQTVPAQMVEKVKQVIVGGAQGGSTPPPTPQVPPACAPQTPPVPSAPPTPQQPQ